MQRLPYNGAPRAHKLRHNVISSSLFNERQQRAAHTFYPGVFVVSALVKFTLSLSLSYTMLSSRAPPSTEPSSPRTCCELCALRCQVDLKRNPPTYRADSPCPYPTREPRFADRDIISTVRTRVTALPIIISLLRAIRIIRDCRICIRDQTRPSLRQRGRSVDISSFGLPRRRAI